MQRKRGGRSNALSYCPFEGEQVVLFNLLLPGLAEQCRNIFPPWETDRKSGFQGLAVKQNLPLFSPPNQTAFVHTRKCRSDGKPGYFSFPLCDSHCLPLSPWKSHSLEETTQRSGGDGEESQEWMKALHGWIRTKWNTVISHGSVHASFTEITEEQRRFTCHEDVPGTVSDYYRWIGRVFFDPKAYLCLCQTVSHYHVLYAILQEKTTTKRIISLSKKPRRHQVP